MTDNPERLITVLRTLDQISERFSQIIFPLHPRTRDVLQRYAIEISRNTKLKVIDPLPPIESLSYIKHAKLVITDGGCVQEEAYILGVPCVTLRENTERHLTVQNGANIVSGFSSQDIHAAVASHLEQSTRIYPNIYGRAGVGDRIVEVLARAGRNDQQTSVTDRSIHECSHGT